MTKTPEGRPEMLTVEEAAGYMGVSRAAGYQLARRYRISGGVEGLPVTRVGGYLWVPRREPDRFVTRGGTGSERYADRRPAWCSSSIV